MRHDYKYLADRLWRDRRAAWRARRPVGHIPNIPGALLFAGFLASAMALVDFVAR